MYELGYFAVIVVVVIAVIAIIKLIADDSSTSKINRKMKDLSKENERDMWNRINKNK